MTFTLSRFRLLRMMCVRLKAMRCSFAALFLCCKLCFGQKSYTNSTVRTGYFLNSEESLLLLFVIVEKMSVMFLFVYFYTQWRVASVNFTRYGKTSNLHSNLPRAIYFFPSPIKNSFRTVKPRI